jgi:hypothetical protein
VDAFALFSEEAEYFDASGSREVGQTDALLLSGASQPRSDLLYHGTDARLLVHGMQSINVSGISNGAC